MMKKLKAWVEGGFESVIERAIFKIQQRRKKQAIQAGVTGLEVYLFMCLASPGEVPEEPSQDEQSVPEEV